jgi:hypothetical protein
MPYGAFFLSCREITKSFDNGVKRNKSTDIPPLQDSFMLHKERNGSLFSQMLKFKVSLCLSEYIIEFW